MWSFVAKLQVLQASVLSLSSQGHFSSGHTREIAEIMWAPAAVSLMGYIPCCSKYYRLWNKNVKKSWRYDATTQEHSIYLDTVYL